MTTVLATDNRIINRRYPTTLDSSCYPQFHVISVPYQEVLFNVFPNRVLFSAVASFREELKDNFYKVARVDLNDLVNSFSKMLLVLLEVNATSIGTQITKFNSLVIKAETPEGNIYTEMFFDETTGWLNETVVNIFQNQQLQFNNSGSLDAMILAIKQYFGSEETDYLSIVNQATSYELSGSAFTTTEV
jgi:hypothetical protein